MINSMKTIPLGVFFTGIVGLAVFILLGLSASANVLIGILFQFYSGLILSFLGGIQWMILAQNNQTQLWKQVLVILPVCFLMVLVAFDSLFLFLIGTIILYLTVYIFDYLYFSKMVSINWYLPLRTFLTCGVVGLKIFMLTFFFLVWGV